MVIQNIKPCQLPDFKFLILQFLHFYTSLLIGLKECCIIGRRPHVYCPLDGLGFMFKLKNHAGLKLLREAIITVKFHYGETNIYKHGA